MPCGVNRLGSAVRSRDRFLREYFGTVTLGAGVIASQDCLGFAVARTGAGAYTATFDDFHTAFYWGDVAMMQATPEDKLYKPVSWTSATRVLVFQTWDISGAAAADLATGAVLQCRFVFRTSNVPRKGI